MRHMTTAKKTLQTMLTSILGSDILCMCQVYLAERRFIVMNKEEILAKSKQENHGQDIASLEVSKASMLFGWITAVCMLAFVAVVEALVHDRMNSGIFFAVMAGCSAIFINKYLKLRKRHELYIAIVYIIATVAFLISWILQLTK
jgi:hypothetical protein